MKKKTTDGQLWYHQSLNLTEQNLNGMAEQEQNNTLYHVNTSVTI